MKYIKVSFLMVAVAFIVGCTFVVINEDETEHEIIEKGVAIVSPKEAE